MKAAVLTGLHQLAIVDLPMPRIENPTDVLLRIRTVGICGSDVHYYAAGCIGSQVVAYPFPVGHEAAAVVHEVGTAVTTVKPGDRVAIDPAIACGSCDECQRGRPHTCRRLRYLGCPGQLDGCLKEFCVMPEECCVPVPDTLDFEAAALVEPLSIGVYAVQRSVPMAGAKIGIFGMGPIGCSVMLPARAEGAAAIYVTDRVQERCNLALAAGADWAGNPERGDIVAEVTEREPALLDVAFECCGDQEALDQAVRLLRPGGKLMVIGIPPFERYSFRAETARRQELTIQHVRRQNGCVQRAIDLLASGRVAAGFMVTHRFGLEQCRQGFDLVERYGDGVLKAMIHI